MKYWIHNYQIYCELKKNHVGYYVFNLPPGGTRTPAKLAEASRYEKDKILKCPFLNQQMREGVNKTE